MNHPADWLFAGFSCIICQSIVFVQYRSDTWLINFSLERNYCVELEEKKYVNGDWVKGVHTFTKWYRFLIIVVLFMTTNSTSRTLKKCTWSEKIKSWMMTYFTIFSHTSCYDTEAMIAIINGFTTMILRRIHSISPFPHPNKFLHE